MFLSFQVPQKHEVCIFNFAIRVATTGFEAVTAIGDAKFYPCLSFIQTTNKHHCAQTQGHTQASNKLASRTTKTSFIVSILHTEQPQHQN